MKFYLPVFVVIAIGLVSSEDCKGCVPLDSLSFDKVVGKFKAAIVKFDVAFPYGEKHEEFGKVAEATRQIEDILVADVGVKDFGNKDNSDLAKRYNINKDDYPVVLLFIQGQSKPERLLTGHSDDFTADYIKRIIRSKTGIYLGLPGCLERLDRLAEEFIAADEKEKKNILDKAQLIEQTSAEEHQAAAKVYVKMMEKILERGNVFVQSEQSRIEGLLKGKLSTEKKRSMQEKRNILQSFAHRDEL